MLHFLGISGTFTGHSISLGVHNGTLDGGLYAQLMMKKHLTDINILHMSFKKKRVINFNHIAKSLKKTINETTLLYKYSAKKLRSVKKAHTRFKNRNLSCNLSSSFL